MAIRIVCPSCSAVLSAKDEAAGRALRCPKCGGTIPASQTTASPTPPAAPTAPQKPAFEVVDESAQPSPPKGGSKVTSQPAARSKDADDEDRPKRRDRDDDRGGRGDRDDDRDERSERKSKDRDRDRGDDRDDDDRPSKKRRRDDDGGDRPRGKKGERRGEEGEKKGGNAGIIVAVICGTLLLCCAGGAGGVWYAMKSAGEKLEEFGESLKEKNDKVTPENFQKLQPLMTRSEVEAILGSGRQAMIWDVSAAFEENPALNPAQVDEWGKKSEGGRVLVWRNKDDYLFVLFHDKPESGGRLQMKAFLPAAGATETSGTMDDARFTRDNAQALAKKGKELSGDAIEITAEQLLTEYHKDKNAADKKYLGKTLVVTAPVSSRSFLGGQVHMAFTFASLIPKIVPVITITVKPGSEKGAGAALTGQTVRFKGRLGEESAQHHLIFDDCEIVEVVPINFVTVTADNLFGEFAQNSQAAAKKYAGGVLDNFKYLHLTNARVTRIEKERIYLTAPTKKGVELEVDAVYYPEDAQPFAKLKIGDRVNVRGQCHGTRTSITISCATVVP